jgi:hypothetical protein
MIAVDDFSTEWLRIEAAAEHTATAEIIGELVRKELWSFGEAKTP